MAAIPNRAAGGLRYGQEFAWSGGMSSRIASMFASGGHAEGVRPVAVVRHAGERLAHTRQIPGSGDSAGEGIAAG